MKVAIVLPYFAPKVGGVENYGLAVALGLKNKGWEVIVVTTGEGKTSHIENIQGLTIYRLPVLFRLSNTPVNPHWYAMLSQIFEETKPDIIDAHTPVPYISDIAIRVAINQGIPSVLTYHNDLFKDSRVLAFISKLYYLLLGNRSLRLSTAIVTTSLYYVQHSQYLKQHQEKVAVIPPGVYPSDLYKSKKQTRSHFVLFVGQLDKTHRHKGVTLLLKAFKKMKVTTNDLKLVVVGKGNDIPYYLELVRDYGLTDSVSFLGFVADKELSKLYAEALCLCLPSTSAAEGFGMVVIEAAQQKTPAIGANIGGISQSIEDGKTGILFEAGNVEALIDAILTLHKNEKLGKTLGENAYQRVKSNFLWSKQIDRTDKLLKKLVT